jgi:hypothetical protein
VLEPDMENKPLGIHLVGGMIGELLITFSCMMEYMHNSPAHETISFKSSDIEAYLTDVLTEEFAENICVLRLKENLRDKLVGEKNFEEQVQEAVAILSNPEIHASYGLRFLIQHSRDSLKIMPEVMEAFFRAIARIALREPRPMIEVPAIEEGENESMV